MVTKDFINSIESIKDSAGSVWVKSGTKVNQNDYNLGIKAPQLTKREYFAGLAMQGWLARCANAPHTHKLQPEVMADISVSMADALLEQLNNKGE